MLLLLLLAQLTPGCTRVVGVTAEEDKTVCEGIVRAAVEAARAAWAPRESKTSGIVAKLCLWPDGTTDNCCLKPLESEKLRCRADVLDVEEKRKSEQAAKVTAAIAALDAVDEACGEMK
jgi:hypothetical protein